MRRRLQANLKGDEDHRNEITKSSSPQQSPDFNNFNCYNNNSNLDFGNYSPEVLSMMSQSPQIGSSPQNQGIGTRTSPQQQQKFKLPPPPAKSVLDLEKESYYGGDGKEPYYHTNYPALANVHGNNQGHEQQSMSNDLPNYNHYEKQMDEQLAGLYKSLNVQDPNNNSTVIKNVSTIS